MDIRVRHLQQLVQPMDGFDIRIAAQLAEDGGALDRLVAYAVKFAEEGGASDLSHFVKFFGWRIGGIRSLMTFSQSCLELYGSVGKFFFQISD